MHSKAVSATANEEWIKKVVTIDQQERGARESDVSGLMCMLARGISNSID